MSTAASPPACDAVAPLRLVVMGVSGSGKSTVAAALAARLGLAFVDGDDLHPRANVDKMRAGIALADDDRWPWLDRVAGRLGGEAQGIVIACSALRRRYRDRIRSGAGGTTFLFLDADAETIAARLLERRGHFMPPSLLASQFAALERPGADETDILVVDVGRPIHDIACDLIRCLRRPSPTGAQHERQG